jgi:hypothetical protein
MISVSQLTMVNDDFAHYCAESCIIPTSFITEMVRRAHADDEACIATSTNICYRAIYRKGGR